MTQPLIGMPLKKAANDAERSTQQAYLDAIALGGGVPMPIPLLQDDDRLRALYRGVDGLCLVGGGDVAPERYGSQHAHLATFIDPGRDRVELALCAWALHEDKPLLAICRGVQVLNVAAGGTLVEDIATLVPGALMHATSRHHPLEYVAHTIDVLPDARLARMLGVEGQAARQVPVNSWHHQALRDVAPPLRVTAVAPDGVIEAVEAGMDATARIVGVQWHPERMVPGHRAMLRLFGEFCALCAPGRGRE